MTYGYSGGVRRGGNVGAHQILIERDSGSWPAPGRSRPRVPSHSLTLARAASQSGPSSSSLAVRWWSSVAFQLAAPARRTHGCYLTMVFDRAARSRKRCQYSEPTPSSPADVGADPRLSRRAGWGRPERPRAMTRAVRDRVVERPERDRHGCPDAVVAECSPSQIRRNSVARSFQRSGEGSTMGPGSWCSSGDGRSIDAQMSSCAASRGRMAR